MKQTKSAWVPSCSEKRKRNFKSFWFLTSLSYEFDSEIDLKYCLENIAPHSKHTFIFSRPSTALGLIELYADSGGDGAADERAEVVSIATAWLLVNSSSSWMNQSIRADRHLAIKDLIRNGSVLVNLFWNGTPCLLTIDRLIIVGLMIISNLYPTLKTIAVSGLGLISASRRNLWRPDREYRSR